MKVSEFNDAVQAVLDNHGESLTRLLGFIESQTQAKQKKFWRYFDSVTSNCVNCDNRLMNDKAFMSNLKFKCCSLGCSIEFASYHAITSDAEIGEATKKILELQKD